MPKLWNVTVFLQLIILSNLFPVYCVFQYGWTFFEVLWLYWLEAVLLVCFDVAYLIMAQVNTGHRNFIQYKIRLGTSMFFIRFFMLLFYVLFMVFVFILGDEHDMLRNAKTLSFQNIHFNYALLSFVVVQYYRYAFNYIGNNRYLTKEPKYYFQIFSASAIVLHIVIVGGVIANTFFNKNNEYNAHKIALLVFIVVKTIATLVQHWLSSDNEKSEQPVYI